MTLDGVDVRAFMREELHRHIAMAFEDATLFSASVRENVLLGRPELTGDAASGPDVSAEAERVLHEALASHRPGSPTGCPTASTRRSARRA